MFDCFHQHRGFQHINPTYIVLDLHLSTFKRNCKQYCIFNFGVHMGGGVYEFIIPGRLFFFNIHWDFYIDNHVISKWGQFYFLLWSVCLLLPSRSIVLSRTASITLNKRAESRYTCLVPDLMRKAVRFSPLSIITNHRLFL